MTGTQKALAAVGALAVVGVILGLTLNNKDEPKKPVVVPTAEAAAPQASYIEPSFSTPGVKLIPPIDSARPVDLATLAEEAKHVSLARDALNAGKPKEALAEIERYEHLPEHNSLGPEALLIKIEALSKVNRRTDALALGLSTRDDPKMDPYRDKVDAVLTDAGLISPPPGVKLP